MLVIPELRMLPLEDKKLQTSLVHGGILSQTIKSWGYSSIARVQSLTLRNSIKVFPLALLVYKGKGKAGA